MKRDNRCKCRDQVTPWGQIVSLEAIRGVPIWGDVRDVIRNVRRIYPGFIQTPKWRSERHALILTARARLRRDFATYQVARS